MAALEQELLTPTLGGHRARDWSSRLPWRVTSQVYVGLIGGPVAVTAIALLNARRLRVGEISRRAMALIGISGLVAGVLAAALVPGQTAPRLFLQLAGVLTYGGLYLVQRAPDRVHSTFSPNDDPDDDYASLLGPGLAAVVLGWSVEIALVLGLEAVT